MGVKELIETDLVRKIKPSKDLAEKEFREADYDLEHAKKSYEEGDYKWAIVKSYYAVFHSAKGVMFSIGLREKAHFAVGEVLDSLSMDGKLENRYVSDFKAALSARNAADYQYDYSKERAEEMIELAEDFIGRMKDMM